MGAVRLQGPRRRADGGLARRAAPHPPCLPQSGAPRPQAGPPGSAAAAPPSPAAAAPAAPALTAATRSRDGPRRAPAASILPVPHGAGAPAQRRGPARLRFPRPQVCCARTRPRRWEPAQPALRNRGRSPGGAAAGRSPGAGGTRGQVARAAAPRGRGRTRGRGRGRPSPCRWGVCGVSAPATPGAPEGAPQPRAQRVGFHTLKLLPQLKKKKEEKKGDFFVRFSNFLRKSSPACPPPSSAAASPAHLPDLMYIRVLYLLTPLVVFLKKERKNKTAEEMH